MATATKTAFLTAYEAALPAAYPWAADAIKLRRFVAAAASTIRTRTATWDHSSTVAGRVFREIGGTGPYSRKALRALPE